MKVTVVGTGYVGLVTGVLLASKGHSLYCVDKDPEKIKKLRNKIIPIYEPGLDNLFLENYERIKPTEDLMNSVGESEVIFIAVGTPFDGEKIDLTYIEEAAREIGDALVNISEFKVIVVKSTVIPNTTLNVVKRLFLKDQERIIPI